MRAALRGARRTGRDTSAVLADAGIAAALLRDDRARVTVDQYTALIQALWDLLDDEFMGFGARRSKRGTFPMMCLLVVHCPDLAAALRRGWAFYDLFDGAPRACLRESGRGSVRFELDTSGFDDPDHFLTESLLLLWHRFASWLIGRRIPLRYVDLGYPEPAHGAEYHLMFGCPLRFRQPGTALGIDARFLAMPVVQDELTLRRYLRRSPADLLSRRDYGVDLASQVRRILAAGLARGPAARPVRDSGSDGDQRRLPSAEEVAARLGMSAPTLRRRLLHDGMSFRAVREQLLRDEAVASLVSGRESVEQLALRLGFSEASAFHRAFRRWTGNSPGAYRAGGHPSTQRPG
ncbi:AraC family transcriptional regulator [Goodfellowiella coeruleoviolacea]|uniref:AraC family transcriptional regulator n=1 Tax=Goodfellowiella coeruleoviolacea TaxID=334858 RepID=UPI0020A24FC6|nr:AraC family transcriptional regulator [Goodfellowiella coeruleoviolacea]